MSSVVIDDTHLTNIANSIREKTGTEDTYKPSEMASAISGIETGGSIDDVFNGTITEISSSGITKIGQYMCYQHPNLVNLDIPNAVSIETYAFYCCYNLLSANIPNVNTLGSRAFQTCQKLESVILSDELEKIQSYTFFNCNNLNLSKLPNNLISIADNAFASCSKLSITELPSGLTTINKNAFNGCYLLAIKEIPAGITSFPYGAFNECKSISELTIKGEVSSIDWSFYGCSNLAKIALPNITTVPSLTSGSAFGGTLIESGTGYIYVPDTLVDSFKSATNWSTYADQIKPISEMPTE